MCKKIRLTKDKAIDLANKFYSTTGTHCSVYFINSNHYNWIETIELQEGLKINVVYDTKSGYIQ